MPDKTNDSNETTFPKVASTVNRRKFLGNLGKAAIASAAVGAVVPLVDPKSSSVSAQTVSILQPRANRRASAAYQARVSAAQFNFNSTLPNLTRPNNGDEAAYPNRIGSYSKGLPH